LIAFRKELSEALEQIPFLDLGPGAIDVLERVDDRFGERCVAGFSFTNVRDLAGIPGDVRAIPYAATLANIT